MSSMASQSPMPVSDVPPVRTPALWRGVLVGLLPLGVLVVIVAAAVALTAGARALTSGQGFATEQLVTTLTLGLGLALAFIGYTLAIVRVWRQMTALRLAGDLRRATGALWALAITALIVLLPVLLALVIPQHPAP